MRLYLLRHTAVGLPAGVCYGKTDVELAPGWRQEFQRLKERLPEDALNPDVVFSSPLARCAQLTEFLFANDFSHDARLTELDFGHWEGRRWDDIARPELDAWSADYVHVAPPGGETLAALASRCEAFLDDLRARSPGTATVVSHSGVILTLLARSLSLELRHAFRLQVSFGSISAVAWDDARTRVEFINR